MCDFPALTPKWCSSNGGILWIKKCFCVPSRVEKLQRKPRPNLVMLRCMRRRSSFWRSRERMWVFFCSYCSSSFCHRGKSLCILVSYICWVSFVSLSGAADRYWRWTSSGTFSGTPWSHSLNRRYSNDFTAVVTGVGRLRYWVLHWY